MERLFTNQDSFQQRTLTYSPPLQTAKDPNLPNVSPPIPSPSLTPPHSGTTPTTTTNAHNNNNKNPATNSIERSPVDTTLNNKETARQPGASLEACAAAMDQSLMRRLPPRKRMQSLKKQFTKPNLSVPCLSMNLVTSITTSGQQQQSSSTAMPMHPAAANMNNNTAAYQISYSNNSNSTTSRSPSPLINIEDDSGDTTETDDEDSWHLHRKRSISESTLLSDDFGRPKQTVIIQQQQQQESLSSIGSAYFTGLMSSVNSKSPPKSSKARQQPSFQSTLDQQPSTKSVTTAPPKLVASKKTKAGTKKKHEKSTSSPSPASSTQTKEYPSITDTTPATTTAVSASAAPARRTKRSDGSKLKAKKSTMLYCICQTPYDATRFMIACDECDQWFHGECIGINEKDGEYIDLYFCGVCGKDTGKKTSWKIKCENSTCVKSARVGASSSSSLPKYCSYKCSAVSQKSRLDMVGKDQHHHHQHIQRCMGILRMIEQKQRFLDMTERQAQNYDICGFDSRLVWDNHLWSKVQRVVETEKDGTVVLLLQQDSKSRSTATQQQQHTWAMDAHRRCQHRRNDCRQHQQWPTLLGLELKKERKIQLQAIESLEKEMDLADASTY